MEDRTLKKYLRSVRRKLNMPKALKDRVMNDFISSVDGRMEEGLTCEQVMAELGTAKAAATELNHQMQAYTYRKSPWRWGCLALAILSGLCIVYHGLAGLLLMMFNKVHNASIGIIGGADGPTAIFVSTANSHSGLPAEVIYVLLLVMGVIGFVALSKLTQK